MLLMVLEDKSYEFNYKDAEAEFDPSVGSGNDRRVTSDSQNGCSRKRSGAVKGNVPNRPAAGVRESPHLSAPPPSPLSSWVLTNTHQTVG